MSAKPRSHGRYIQMLYSYFDSKVFKLFGRGGLTYPITYQEHTGHSNP